MNIKYLQKLLFRIDEIKIIGKSAEIDGVIYNVAGLVRYGAEMRLIILDYDEKYRTQIEEREMSELCNDRQKPETNRILLKGREYALKPLRTIKSVFIGDKEFEVSGSESRALSLQDGESVLFLSELLRNGWNPEGVDYQRIDMLYLSSIELKGEFSKIPDFENNPSLHFTMRNDSVGQLVEQPITLTINGEYPEKLWFKNKATGEEHWAQINSVYLQDMWAEMEMNFSNPKLLEQIKEEEISKVKKDFEEHFTEICPRGMCFPIVEYECDESISLEFYTKKYLDSEPAQNSRAIGFIVGSDKKTGALGMKLRAVVIQEPVDVNTVSIEAELFQYYKTITPKDIIMK